MREKRTRHGPTRDPLRMCSGCHSYRGAIGMIHTYPQGQLKSYCPTCWDDMQRAMARKRGEILADAARCNPVPDS